MRNLLKDLVGRSKFLNRHRRLHLSREVTRSYIPILNGLLLYHFIFTEIEGVIGSK